MSVLDGDDWFASVPSLHILCGIIRFVFGLKAFARLVPTIMGTAAMDSVPLLRLPVSYRGDPPDHCWKSVLVSTFYNFAVMPLPREPARSLFSKILEIDRVNFVRLFVVG